MEEIKDRNQKVWQVQTILSKVVGGEDIEWPEMAALDGFNVSPEQLRKIGQGVKLVYDAGLMKDPGDADETEFEKVRKEKQKMWDLRREANEVYRVEARDELLRESIVRAAAALPRIVIPEFSHSTTPNPDRALVVPIADAHYGREIVIRGLMGEILNEYNPEIFEQRMADLLRQVIELVEETHASEVVVPNLGDSIDGMLRCSQLMTIRYGMVDSAMMFAEYLAAWLNELSTYVPVRFVCLGGNHDSIRVLGAKKASDFPRENLGRIIGWFIAERLKDNPRISVSFGKDMELVEICGSNALMIHGENESKSGDAAQDYGFLYNIPIDYVFRGHLHSFSDMAVGVNRAGQNVYEIQSPSICGIDDYSISLKSRAAAGSVGVLMERGCGKKAVFMLTTP